MITVLVISFVLMLKGPREGFMVMYFLYYYCGSAQANRVIHGEGSTGVSDRVIEVS